MNAKPRRRLLSVLFALAMAAGLMSAMAATAYADDSADSPIRKVEVANAEHGKVTASVASAKEGDSVTLTITPENGYGLKSLTASYREAFTEEIDAAHGRDESYGSAYAPAARSEHFESDYISLASEWGWLVYGHVYPRYGLEISPKTKYWREGYSITGIELYDANPVTTKEGTYGFRFDVPYSSMKLMDDGKGYVFSGFEDKSFSFHDDNATWESPRKITSATIHALTGVQQSPISDGANANEKTFTVPAGDVTVSAVFKELPKVNAPSGKYGNNKLVYNGQPQELVNGGSAENGVMMYALGDANGATEPYSFEVPKATNAGPYRVWYKVVADANHADFGPNRIDTAIAQAEPTCNPPTVQAYYLQDRKDLVFENPQGNTPGTWKLKNSEGVIPYYPGKDYLTAIFTPDDTVNYIPMQVEAPVEVSKAVLEPPTIFEKPYTGQPQTANVPTSNLYTVTKNDGGTNVGSYDVELELTWLGNRCYRWPNPHSDNEKLTTLTFEIKDILLPTAEPMTYDPSKTLENVPLIYAPGWDWEWVDKTIKPEAGNNGYKVILRDVEDKVYDLTNVDGYDSESHTITRTIPLTVEKASVDAPTIVSKPYTGEAQTADVQDTDYYTVTANGGGKSVGNYDVVLTLTDAVAANYKWEDSEEAAKTLTFQITKAEAPEIAVPAISKDITYDPAKTLNDVVPELPDGWTWENPNTVPNAGSWGYNAKSPQVDDTNYDYSNVEGYDETSHTVTRAVPLTVKKATFPLEVTLDGWTYGEEAKTPAFSANPGNGEVAYAYDRADAENPENTYRLTAPTDAGEYIVGAYIYPTENYEEAFAMASFTIAKASIDSIEIADIAAPELNATLDATATTGTAGITLGDVTWGPSAKTATYATAYKATVKVTPDANHTLAENVSATVDGKPATVSKNADGTLSVSYTFDKTELMPASIAGGKWVVVYDANGIPVSLEDMFVMPAGAGKASYKVTPGTGKGTFANGKLTVTKCGTFTVQVSTLASDTHKAASATATLIVTKDNPSFSTAARTLAYNGKAQKLMQAASTTGGTLQYALGTSATKAPAASAYTKNIPTATAAKTYYVWHKVVGGANYNDSKPVCTKVKIVKAANKLTVKTAAKTVKASSKAQKAKCFKKVKPKFKAKVTYKKATTAAAKKLSGYKVLSVNKKTGKITVKKGAKAGTYKLMVKVSAAKTANTNATSKTVTVTVKVKGKAAKATKATKSLKAQSVRL